MYMPKGTTISYRMVKIKNEKGVEQEMILIDKDVFESIIAMLGFEKQEKTEERAQEQK